VSVSAYTCGVGSTKCHITGSFLDYLRLSREDSLGILNERLSLFKLKPLQAWKGIDLSATASPLLLCSQFYQRGYPSNPCHFGLVLKWKRADLMWQVSCGNRHLLLEEYRVLAMLAASKILIPSRLWYSSVEHNISSGTLTNTALFPVC